VQKPNGDLEEKQKQQKILLITPKRLFEELNNHTVL